MSWAYNVSGDIENAYYGEYATREEAIAAAVRELAGCGDDAVLYIAQDRPPRVDFAGVDLPEHLAAWVEEDFGGPAAEDWPAFNATEQQLADLTRAIEAAFVAWLERHGMTPDWRVIEDPERLTLGAAREMAAKSAS